MRKLRYTVKKSSYDKNSKTKTEEFFLKSFSKSKGGNGILYNVLMNASVTGLKTGTLIKNSFFLMEIKAL